MASLLARLRGQGGGLYDPDQAIPDLAGKCVVVTGGNIGLGKEAAKQLARHNAHVYLCARTESKAQGAIDEIKAEVPHAAITYLPLDLASFESIKQAAKAFEASSDRLDILMNNAGLMASPPAQTKEGYEIQFGTNHMGHALLTKLLLPILQRTAKEPNSDVRIINLSSEGYRMAFSGGILFDEAKTDMAARSTWGRYGMSKLANVHFTRELARRYPEIKSIAIHPGAVKTNLSTPFTTSHPWIGVALSYGISVFAQPVKVGALNQLWACSSPDAKSGVFYFPVGVDHAGAGKYVNDAEQARELWEWTQKEFASHDV